jgi:uncharacterized protein (DUF1697 family)
MPTTCIALLRGVNVGGRTMLPMATLRTFLEELGFDRPTTLLQSGNAVFRTSGPVTPALEARIEKAATRLPVATTIFLRSSSEWRQLIDANPFEAEAASDPSHMVLICLKQPATPAAIDALRAAIRGPERVQLRGRELYAVYPDGMGRSKLTGAMIEKALGTRATARNWNTVLKLAALARDL